MLLEWTKVHDVVTNKVIVMNKVISFVTIQIIRQFSAFLKVTASCPNVM